MARLLLVFILCLGSATAAEKPNILWIVSEDNDSQWLGCYGNKQAQTPTLDKLAAGGVQFQSAYSNAPVCAVARSTIINGAYAITQGTQHMRSRHKIPTKYLPYVSYLKKQGYYCTNNSKTDYNFQGNDKAIWDKSSKQAHYKSRPDGAPFLAIFSLTTSHESSLFPDRIKQNRERKIIPEQPRISPDKVTVPPYLPDLPEIRRDIAIYHDNMTALDTQIGEILAELKKSGLAENTIIFYYSDHGGITPRGKRYLKDTGVKVPMLVHFPKKWQHLSPFKVGEKVNEVVSFVDLAPTLLSLLGMEKPAQMQGRAFLGRKRTEPIKDNYALLYADRFDEIYGMRRGITDGRWKYIRRFTPNLSAAPYSYFQFGQDGWTAWQKAWKEGKLTDNHNKIWEPNQSTEELFDTQADPWEIKNLATDPAHAERLMKMRSTLKTAMIEARDIGIIPEPMFAALSPDQPMAHYVATHKDQLPALIDLAYAASSRDVKNLEKFTTLAKSKHPIERYWAAQGLLILGKSATPAEETLQKLTADPHSAIRIAAAQTLFVIGKEKSARAAMLAELDKELDEYSLQNAINALRIIDALGDIPQSWVEKTLANPNAGKYIIRMAKKLKK